MNRIDTPPRALLERWIFLLATLVLLVVAHQTLPHGDALRVVRQIEASSLIWNPNHLVFDPLGYGFYHLVHRFSEAATPLGTFQFLASVSTLVTLAIFHAVLLRAGVASAMVRVATLIGVLASACFLALAGSQYFFMIQMPFLVGSIYLYFDFLLKTREGRAADRNLYWIGVLLAISTTIMFNNLLLVAFLGFVIGLDDTSWKSWRWRSTLKVYVAAALVGFPVFLAGHWLSGTPDGLFTWLLSYAGDSETKLNAMYGLNYTVQGITAGLAMIGFNYFIGNLVELSGLGNILQVLVLGQELQFLPPWSRIALGCAAVPLALLFHITVTWYLLTRIRTKPVARFMATWLASYLLFNFLWNVGDEIFWLQIVPVTWLVFLMSQGKMPLLVGEEPAPRRPVLRVARSAPVLLGIALLFLAVNSVNALMPLSSPRFADNQRRHLELLREGDLEIIPGWDRFKWMLLDERAPPIQRQVLMNMAVAAIGSGYELHALPGIIDAQLDRGGRVIVARVYDKDGDLMPWYGMSELGWPRGRILELLQPFCTTELTRIEGVVFRELHRCEAAATPPAAQAAR